MRYWLLVFSVVAAVVLGVSITRVVQQDDSKTSNNPEWEATVQGAVDKYVDKPLNLPYVDSLYVSELEYSAMSTFPFKIVNFLDGDCSTCLIKISFWKEFASELNTKYNIDVPVIMYTYSSFEENMRDYMIKEWSGRQWQFDRGRSFIESNELWDLRLQTALLDSENRVILIGYPLLNPKLRKLYVKTIRSLL